MSAIQLNNNPTNVTTRNTANQNATSSCMSFLRQVCGCCFAPTPPTAYEVVPKVPTKLQQVNLRGAQEETGLEPSLIHSMTVSMQQNWQNDLNISYFQQYLETMSDSCQTGEELQCMIDFYQNKNRCATTKLSRLDAKYAVDFLITCPAVAKLLPNRNSPEEVKKEH